jgi:hypothetical protein
MNSFVINFFTIKEGTTVPSFSLVIFVSANISNKYLIKKQKNSQTGTYFANLHMISNVYIGRNIIKTDHMKTINFRAMSILVGLVLVSSQRMVAGVMDSVTNNSGNQMSNLNTQGLIVMGGIVGASLVLYILTTYVIKDKSQSVLGQKPPVNRHNHNRHHHNRQVVKKTS